MDVLGVGVSAQMIGSGVEGLLTSGDAVVKAFVSIAGTSIETVTKKAGQRAV